jgi:hypothetical protein
VVNSRSWQRLQALFYHAALSVGIYPQGNRFCGVGIPAREDGHCAEVGAGLSVSATTG